MKRFNFQKFERRTNVRKYRQCQRIGHVLPYDQRVCRSCGVIVEGHLLQNAREAAPYFRRRFPRWFRKFQWGRGTASAEKRMMRLRVKGGTLMTPALIRELR